MSCKTKWDEKYAAMQKRPAVNEALKRFFHLAPKGVALDIACGLGQNSLFLAQKGFKVDAVDISQVAIEKINHPNIRTYCCDINDFDFAFNHYSLIFCSNFLDRSIFAKIIHALKEEGILIYTTFNYRKKDFNPHYLLQKNELLEAFMELEILYYEALDDRSLIVAKKSAEQ